MRYYCVGDHKGTTPIYTPFTQEYPLSLLDCYNGVESYTLALKVAQKECKPIVCHELPGNLFLDTLAVSIEEESVEVISTDNQIHTGYKLCSVDIDRDWTNIAMTHGKKFRRGKLLVVKTLSSGFETRETYQCTQCHIILIKRASFDVNKHSKTKGRASSDLNLSMAVVMYCSATNVTKMNEMCSLVGIASPSLNRMYKNNRMLKHQILEFSTE